MDINEYISLARSDLTTIGRATLDMSERLKQMPEYDFLVFGLNRVFVLVSEVFADLKEDNATSQIKSAKKEGNQFLSMSDKDFIAECRVDLMDAGKSIVKMSQTLSTVPEYEFLAEKFERLIVTIGEVFIDFNEALQTIHSKDPTLEEEVAEMGKADMANKIKTHIIQPTQKAKPIKQEVLSPAEQNQKLFNERMKTQNLLRLKSTPPVRPVKELKKKQPAPSMGQKAETNMNIETLIALADKFDEAGEKAKASIIDELIKKVAVGIDIDPAEEQKIMKEDEKVNKELGEIPIETKLGPIEPAIEQLKRDNAVSQSKPETTIDEELKMLKDFDDVLFAARGAVAKAFYDKGIQVSFNKEMQNAIKALHAVIEHFNSQAKLADLSDIEGSAPAEVFKKLAEIADTLDASGAVEEANMIDAFITAHAAKKDERDPYDSKQHHLEQIRENKKEEKDRDGRAKHHVAPYQETGVGALQTRYCPDHLAVMLARVGESSWQCSLDGQIFNFETGYVDANGVKHPGGSISQQTPSASNQPIPHRIFDSTEKTLNVIN